MISVHILFITPTYQTEIDLHTQKNDAEIATMISVDRTESTTVEDEVVDIDHKLLKGFKELYKHIMVSNSITNNQNQSKIFTHICAQYWTRVMNKTQRQAKLQDRWSMSQLRPIRMNTGMRLTENHPLHIIH